MPKADGSVASRRTRRGRLLMTIVLLVCMAPVLASYLAYFVIKPDGRTNYSELVEPRGPIPSDLPLVDLKGDAVAAESLKGQWLFVVVSRAACDSRCERYLWVQRQLHETLGVDAGRVDKLWLVDDASAPRPQTLSAVASPGPASAMTVLRVQRDALVRWLRPAAGHALEDHIYIVDPMGDWMMRSPVDPDPAKLKRDVVKLLRASAGWDQPGR